MLAPCMITKSSWRRCSFRHHGASQFHFTPQSIFLNSRAFSALNKAAVMIYPNTDAGLVAQQRQSPLRSALQLYDDGRQFRFPQIDWIVTGAELNTLLPEIGTHHNFLAILSLKPSEQEAREEQ